MPLGPNKPVSTSECLPCIQVETKLAQATRSAMVDTGEKVEYKLQGTILRVKKANGDVSSVVAGKSVVLKSVTEDGNERGVL